MLAPCGVIAKLRHFVPVEISIEYLSVPYFALSNLWSGGNVLGAKVPKSIQKIFDSSEKSTLIDVFH